MGNLLMMLSNSSLAGDLFHGLTDVKFDKCNVVQPDILSDAQFESSVLGKSIDLKGVFGE